MTKQRCPYCDRPNRVSAACFAENPFCRLCLHERMDKAAKERGPVVAVLDGDYVTFVTAPSSDDLPGWGG